MDDLIVLSCLTGGAKHGYQIKKEAGLILGAGELHNNLVYPLLHRLERKKWVARRKAPGRRGQTRLMYHLTPEGIRGLVRRLAQYPEGDSSPEAFYLRVGLIGMLPLEVRARILDARAEQLRLEGKHFERLLVEFDPPAGHGREILEFLQRKTRLELDWVHELRREARPEDGPGTRLRGATNPGASRGTRQSVS